MNPPALQTVDLSKSFDTADGVLEAVRHINLVVEPGDFVCIVGPSGCGKSTLLQLLGGLLTPTSGEVLLTGRPLHKPPPDISIVFQKPNLMPWRTVRDNVLLPAEIQSLPAEEAKKRADQALALVGLTAFARAYPKALSRGMEQRASLARALMQDPSILLLDEPFGSLDALTRERLNREILSLWRKRNLTAIMVTHDIREAVFLADRVVVLSPRPAMIDKEFFIDLPRSRPEGIEYSEHFGALAYEIRQAIRE